MIHEWWGLNDWVKEQAAKLADQGYVALAIDLYRGKVATTPEQAHEVSRALPDDRVARDLNAAFDFLKSQNNVKAGRIASIGWCMGGGIAFDLALQQPTLYTSALAEMSNIVVSSYVGGVAAAVGLTLVPSIPHVGGGTLAETMEAAFGDLDSSLLLVTDLRLPGVRYAGRIVAAPVDESLSRLLSMLGVV